MTSNKNVAFDVVGILVGYEQLYTAIEERLGDKLREIGVKPDMFGYMWVRTTPCLPHARRPVLFSKTFPPSSIPSGSDRKSVV